MSYYIGIDIGTSSVKAMLINENEIQNTISKDYPIYLSNGNYAEQNPEDWYRQSMLAMKELLRDVLLVVCQERQRGVQVAVAPAFQAIHLLFVAQQGKRRRRAQFQTMFDGEFLVHHFHHGQNFTDFVR